MDDGSVGEVGEEGVEKAGGAASVAGGVNAGVAGGAGWFGRVDEGAGGGVGSSEVMRVTPAWVPRAESMRDCRLVARSMVAVSCGAEAVGGTTKTGDGEGRGRMVMSPRWRP